jgi:hypothetical protein
MNNSKNTLISTHEIEQNTYNMFIDYTDKIIGKSNPFNGERYFVLSVMEQLAGLLKRPHKNDRLIIIHTQTLLRTSLSHNEYINFLTYIDPLKLNQCENKEPLSPSERIILHELMQHIYHEYLMKDDFISCCYTAMNAFIITTYCIISRGINNFVSEIDITVDIYDTVTEISLLSSKNKPKVIIVDWHGINKINDLYMLYLTQYPGLEKSSILDLVSADVIEEEYYIKDERFTIAPSLLMKQYLAIIEREVNAIIQLSNLPNTQSKHLKWYDMKNYVRKRGINIDYLPFKLHEALDDLYQFRNTSMHGETDISNDDYEILLKYKNQSFFKGLSVKKLELQDIILHPTVDEIGEYTGLRDTT